MEVTFEINTYEGDGLIVSLSSSYDYIKEFVGSKGYPPIEVIDMSIIRKKGCGSIPLVVLKEIVSKTTDILLSSPDAVLFYLCDSTEPIPHIRQSRDLLCQQYRDRLFTAMFERFCLDFGNDWNDYRIEASIHGAPQYAHLIFRNEHRDVISVIGQEIKSMFDIIEAEK